MVAGIGNTNCDLYAAGHRPQNFYMLGSMGLACPIALGVALAQPERGVIALEGDGSILMSLGCLATIAKVKPRNLTIVIWDNGIYQITGKQATATGGVTDIVAVARAPASPTRIGCATRRISTQLMEPALRRRRAGVPGGQDRRQARRGADAARSGADPQSLHDRARHQPRRRARRLSVTMLRPGCFFRAPRLVYNRASKSKKRMVV